MIPMIGTNSLDIPLIYDSKSIYLSSSIKTPSESAKNNG